MSLLRHKQPVITRIFPHQGNRRYLIPNRHVGKDIGPSDPNTTLAYRFTDGTLDPWGGVGPVLTFTRNTEGTYYDAAGILQTAAIDEPRFDHDPADKHPLGLLIEEARTNILTQSENLSLVWNNVESIDNQAAGIAPDGALTANQIVDDDTGGNDRQARVNTSVTVATSTAYVYSIYAKTEGVDWVALTFESNGALVISAYFDLTNGSVGGTVGADVDTTFIEPIKDGWYRIGIGFVTDAVDTTGAPNIYLCVGDGNPAVPHDGTSSILCWGFDLEAGAFSTSYIKTVGTVVERGADNCSTTDMSWLNPVSLHTLYVKFKRLAAASNAGIATLNSGTDYLRMVGQAAGQLQMINRSVPTGVGNLSSTIIPVTSSYNKMAVGLEQGDSATAIDGALTNVDQSQTLFNPANIVELVIGALVLDSFILNGHIAELAYNTERKPDEFLADLTSSATIYPGGV